MGFSFLEEQRRKEIPILNRELPADVLYELNRCFPGYECVYRADGPVWVLYHVKARGGCPADDLLFLQFVLPDTPGMWLLDLMRKMDRSNESPREWWLKNKAINERARDGKRKRIQHILEEEYNDRHAFIGRGRTTVCKPAT